MDMHKAQMLFPLDLTLDKLIKAQMLFPLELMQVRLDKGIVQLQLVLGLEKEFLV